MSAKPIDLKSPPDVCAIDFFDIKKIRKLKKKIRPESELHELSDVFSILSDTTRLKIVLALIETELCVCDIAGFWVSLSRPSRTTSGSCETFVWSGSAGMAK